jgi:hypothetical protein
MTLAGRCRINLFRKKLLSMKMSLIKSGYVKTLNAIAVFKLLVLGKISETSFHDNYSTRDFEKKIKIPSVTDTDYVIFLIRSAKQNIQLSYKVKVTTKVV